MLGLIRDWLLDPAALLFLSSIALLLWQICGIRQRGAQRPSATEQRGASDVGNSGIVARTATSKRWSIAALILWLSGYAVSTAPVVVNPLIVLLEQPYVSGEACTSGSHLVLLGGGVDSRVRSATDFYRMRPATFVRSSYASQIVLAEPGLRVVIAGGAIEQIAEADVIAEYLMSLGIPKSQLLLESRSANTRENALNVAQLLATDTIVGPVRLVTSALHMRRALSTFERAFEGTGVTFCPVSTDRQGLLDIPAYAWMPQTTSLVKFDLLLHEVVALVVYRLRSWI